MVQVLQYFKDFYVYDSEVVEENDESGKKYLKIKRSKIQILEEKISDGATVPTYLAKYPDGYKASISKDMYCATQEEADNKLLKELVDSRYAISAEMRELTDTYNRIIQAASTLKVEIESKPKLSEGAQNG